MKFTDIFIRRPVLASVVSLLILVLGLRALGTLQVLQYPQTQNAVVTINTVYYGALTPRWSPASSPRRWKTPSPRANGIDYMTSTSTQGVSTIMVYLRLNYDADKALTEINTKIASVLSQLPNGTQQPTLTVRVLEPDPSTPCISASTVRCWRRTRSPTTSCGSCSQKLQAIPGMQERLRSSAANISRAAGLAGSEQAGGLWPDRC